MSLCFKYILTCAGFPELLDNNVQRNEPFIFVILSDKYMHVHGKDKNDILHL